MPMKTTLRTGMLEAALAWTSCSRISPPCPQVEDISDGRLFSRLCGGCMMVLKMQWPAPRPASKGGRAERQRRGGGGR
jgi:hypothetical protein